MTFLQRPEVHGKWVSLLAYLEEPAGAARYSQISAPSEHPVHTTLAFHTGD